MSKYISSEAKSRIKNRIETIEKKSSAEIVVVVTQFVKSYKYLAIFYSLVFTFPFTFLYMVLGYEMKSLFFIEIVVVTYLFIYYLLYNSSIMSKITPKIFIYKRCEEFALSQFVKLGIDKTENHKAILIFICLKSRYIRVVADREIDRVVSGEVWQNIVKRFIKKAKDGRVEDGILEIVDSCGEILTKNFPRDKESKDELSNEVLEI